MEAVMAHYRQGVGERVKADPQHAHLIRQLDRALLAEARALGWARQVERCQSIPGVGPLTAVANGVSRHEMILAQITHGR
jgi:hypothetical protein